MDTSVCTLKLFDTLKKKKTESLYNYTYLFIFIIIIKILYDGKKSTKEEERKQFWPCAMPALTVMSVTSSPKCVSVCLRELKEIRAPVQTPLWLSEIKSSDEARVSELLHSCLPAGFHLKQHLDFFPSCPWPGLCPWALWAVFLCGRKRSYLWRICCCLR